MEIIHQYNIPPSFFKGVLVLALLYERQLRCGFFVENAIRNFDEEHEVRP